MYRTLVLYVLHQDNDRVHHFLRHAIFNDENTDFVIIINDPDIVLRDVPDHVRVISRSNVGYDFGGWSDALEQIDLNHYDYFVFVNSSVWGPFLSEHPGKQWTDIYIDGLRGNIKLFGSTINTAIRPHVQSYIFAIDRQTLRYLMDVHIFSTKHYAASFQDAIMSKEVEMSNKIIQKGWNIGSLLRLYKDIDFTRDSYPHYDDVMYPAYRDTLWTSDEVVFIKGNRFGH